jgi:hypothetical protein
MKSDASGLKQSFSGHSCLEQRGNQLVYTLLWVQFQRGILHHHILSPIPYHAAVSSAVLVGGKKQPGSNFVRNISLPT